MAKATNRSPQNGQPNDGANHHQHSHSNAAPPKDEEHHGLLAGHESDDQDDLDGDSDDGIIVHPGRHSNDHDAEHDALGPRTPRTPNRVRFDLTPTNIPPAANGTTTDDSIDSAHALDSFDYFDQEPGSGGGRDRTLRRPLLTDIEAPSVTVANGLSDDDVHSWAERERARPKSGLRSAFMNMANSIIGAGIIGQPYAFKDAGLIAGIVLLVGLTVVIDWTIRLIVINSKLSGASSFQGTVEHCFGKTGLIAISVAQWAFAFGGMVAFGVIVGDSVPPVFRAIWPNLHEIPVLSLLGDRRAVIVIFTLGISYPLTLYRDIAKVRSPAMNKTRIYMLSTPTTCANRGNLVGKSEHTRSHKHGHHRGYCGHTRCPHSPRRSRVL